MTPGSPDITPHNPGHTTASLAISAGANPKAVERMLGDASAAMTLDTNPDLFEDDLDAVRAQTVVRFFGGHSVPDMKQALQTQRLRAF